MIEAVLPFLNIPEWATHIATREEVPKLGFAVWDDVAQEYYSEDPESVEGNWANAYDMRYWKVTPINPEYRKAEDKTITREMAEELASKLTVGDKFATTMFVYRDGSGFKATRYNGSITKGVEVRHNAFIVKLTPSTEQ